MILRHLIIVFAILCVFTTTTRTVVGQAEEEDSAEFMAFMDACVKDDVAAVRTTIETHPTWVNQRSSKGETCLHVAGIRGAPAVTEAVLQAGGDPNIRSTYEYGLRMHPLSWNAFAGHVENARLLLKADADPNLDFDKMSEPGTKLTALDVVEQILRFYEDDRTTDARHEGFKEFHKLLLSVGGKRYHELETGNVQDKEF